jgi:hypothetical protein
VGLVCPSADPPEIKKVMRRVSFGQSDIAVIHASASDSKHSLNKQKHHFAFTAEPRSTETEHADLCTIAIWIPAV